MKDLLHRTYRTGTALLMALIIAVAATGLSALFLFAQDEPDLSYRSVHQDVTMLDNGDLRIDQIIDVKLLDRDDPWRQLFQTYNIAENGVTSISDISVTNLDTGVKYAQGDATLPSDVDRSTWETQYANHWYIADADSREPYNPNTMKQGRVEIGWNIPATVESDSMRFKISMIWHGGATKYRDVTAMLWEPVSTQNEVPIGLLSGTFHFPQGAKESNTWAWLHYTGTSTTSRDTNNNGDTVLQWKAWDVHAGQYVDLSLMVDNSIIGNVSRQVDEDYKATLLNAEKEDELKWREQQRDTARMQVVALVALIIVVVAATIGGVLIIIHNARAIRKACDNGVYYRQAPTMSPASASILSDTCLMDQPHRSQQYAATILSLANKGYILLLPGKAAWYESLEVQGSLRQQARNASDLLQKQQMQHQSDLNSSGSNRVTIILQPESDEAMPELYESERVMLSMLRAVGKVLGVNRFDTKQMSKIAKRKLSSIDRTLLSTTSEHLSEAVNTEFALLGATQHSGMPVDALAGLNIAAGVGFVLLASAMSSGLVILLPAGIAWFLGVSLLLLNVRKKLTAQGTEYAQQVMGLRRYLLDYSSFENRDVQSLILWNDYLVYATAMGIADKAMQQLMMSYPEAMNNPDWLDSYAVGTLLYWPRYRTYYGAPVMGSSSVNVDQVASSFVGGWADLGTSIGGSVASLQSTISAADFTSNGSGKSSWSGGSFSGGGFGGASGGIGGGSFGGR